LLHIRDAIACIEQYRNAGKEAYLTSTICENCGEYYLSDDMTGQVLERAEAAVKSGAEVEILRFAA
jgi:hypothetical protein